MLATLKQPSVGFCRKALNFIGCIIAGYVFFFLVIYSSLPLTLDIVFTIFLAEYCRWANERRRQKVSGSADYGAICISDEKDPTRHWLDSIATVVGFREDPALFTRALESYRQAQHCKLLLVCVDGDAKEDQEMVNVFKRVSSSAFLYRVLLLMVTTRSIPTMRLSYTLMFRSQSLHRIWTELDLNRLQMG